MTKPVAQLLDSMRLLVDLQRVSAVVQRLKGCLDSDEIAKCATDGLIDEFGCALARIWLMEPDRTSLRLVASSGIYTHTDGFFSKVPVGAFKVGKIAQNRIPFLSNNLPDEAWVKDREWAIEHQITGFAGYPLAIEETVIGVLAVFSRHSLSAEFLEVLQGLCTTLAIMLENALLLQRQPPLIPPSTQNFHPLSEQLDAILKSTRLSLIGTERPLTASATYILLQLTEILAEMNCTYCRLSYEAEQISLEAIVFLPEMPPSLEQDVAMLIASSQSTSQPNTPQLDALRFIPSQLNDLLMAVTCLGGTLQTLTGVYQNALQVVLRLPYPTCRYAPWLRIHCTSPILQAAFTTLAHQAGLNIYSRINHPLDPSLPLLTDDLTQIQTAQRVLWLGSETAPVQEIMAIVDVNMTPGQLREAVEAVARGETWGDVAASSSKIISSAKSPQTRLSEREREILQLLAHGLRDRDIANQLHISERTVKFHMNNVLTKVKARTRAQAIYLSTLWGWLDS